MHLYRYDVCFFYEEIYDMDSDIIETSFVQLGQYRLMGCTRLFYDYLPGASSTSHSVVTHYLQCLLLTQITFQMSKMQAQNTTLSY